MFKFNAQLTLYKTKIWFSPLNFSHYTQTRDTFLNGEFSVWLVTRRECERGQTSIIIKYILDIEGLLLIFLIIISPYLKLSNSQQFPISILCRMEFLLLKSILAVVCKYFGFKCECEILAGAREREREWYRCEAEENVFLVRNKVGNPLVADINGFLIVMKWNVSPSINGFNYVKNGGVLMPFKWSCGWHSIHPEDGFSLLQTTKRPLLGWEPMVSSDDTKS